MVKHSSVQHENKPNNYYSNVKAAQKEKKSTPQVLPGLKADALPGSHVTPAKKTGFQKINIRFVADIIMMLAILCLLWYVVSGPGHPKLEHMLVGLKPSQPTAVQQILSTPMPTTALPFEPSFTSSPTFTYRPTNTPIHTKTPTATHTHISPTATSTITQTPTPDCWQAVDITLDDVGKTLCVRGIVTELISKPNSFLVIFSHSQGAFYWVSYDMQWSQAKPRSCYQLESVIMQMGNNPIQIFDYSNFPEECP